MDGKAGLAFFMMVRHADTVTVDKKSGFARCNHIHGLGRIQDAEAVVSKAAVEAQDMQVEGEGKAQAA